MNHLALTYSFQLNDAAKEELLKTPFEWGFGLFSQVVFYRTYSRKKEDGTQENIQEATIRVLEGVMSIRKNYYLNHCLNWDEDTYQKLALEMGRSLLKRQWSPPGRGMWSMGSPFIYTRGSAALFNCAFVKLDEVDGSDFEWMMDMLMCGVGVGFYPEDNQQKVTDLLKATEECTLDHYIIPDTREGWAESVKYLVAKLFQNKEINPDKFFDYSVIRPEGSPIKTFGGTASGPGPLIKLHKQIVQYFSYLRAGKTPSNLPYTLTHLRTDIANAIGCCVVAGNVRRSALIALAPITNKDFLDLKDYEKNPYRADVGWMSNNSATLDNTEDFLNLPEIAARVIKNGEPGYLNRMNIKYGRVGKLDEKEKYGILDDAAEGINPCQPGFATLLTPEGIRTFDDVKEGSLIWSEDKWVRIINKISSGVKKVYRYTTSAGVFIGTENHRVVSKGKKVEVDKASSIDRLIGEETTVADLDPRDILDGLLFGDGMVHKASNNKILLCVGKKDQDYFLSEVKNFINPKVTSISPFSYEVYNTSLSPEELPRVWERRIPERFLRATKQKVAGFLRGLFSANGSINVEGVVSLKTASPLLAQQVQLLLSYLHIPSYIVSEKGKPTRFKNQTRDYTAKDSFTVNTRQLLSFKKTVGFIQSYKQSLLDVHLTKRTRNIPRKTFPILGKEYLGEFPVFDITVDGPSHTYWSGGLNVSNCGEIPLENYETCNLAETYPGNCQTEEDWYKALTFATFYATTVNLLPTHLSDTNKVVAKNRRIGVSISGFAQWKAKIPLSRLTLALRHGYKVVRQTNDYWSADAGVPRAIRVTTVKPSGSISKVFGVTSGAHHPPFSKVIRRINFDDKSDLKNQLIDLGVPHEKSAYSDNTTVLEFPVDYGNVKPAQEVSIWEQANNLMLLQREWADNAVSVTVYFSKDEQKEVESVLSMIAPHTKSASLLPHTEEGVYAQMPEEHCSDEEYQRRSSAIIAKDLTSTEEAKNDDTYCAGGACVLNQDQK